MRYIIQPSERLRGVQGNPATNPRYFEQLFDSREKQLEALWNRISVDVLKIDAERRLLASRQKEIRILSGVGDLLIEDTLPNFEQLLRHPPTWLKVYPVVPLPKIKKSYAKTTGAATQPWHLRVINKPATLTGTGFVVGVVDSGFDKTRYPDFLPPFPAAFGFYDPVVNDIVSGVASKDDDNAGSTPEYHGSGVCGFLAGAQSGVAPGASVAVAGIPANTVISQNDDLIKIGLDWLVKVVTSTGRGTGCDIISLSQQASNLGVYGPVHLYNSLLDIRDECLTLVVAAVGNDPGAPNLWQCPGAFDCVVSVGSVDALGNVVGSAYGTIPNGLARPDIVAPGELVEQPLTGGGTQIRKGTSYAAPIVAGAAALILEKAPAVALPTPHLRFRPVDLRTKLLSCVVPPTTTLAGAGGNGVLDLSLA